MSNYLQLTKQALLKAASQSQDAFKTVCHVLRVLNPILKPVVSNLLANSNQDSDILFILGVVLQYTNEHNFSILSKLIENQPNILQQRNTQKSLETLYRVFEAQPYLLKVWNCSGLFNSSLDHAVTQQPNLVFLLKYLRQMAAPGNKHLTQSQVNIEGLEYLDSLRLNKNEEASKQEYFAKLFGDLALIDRENVSASVCKKMRVMTRYLSERVKRVLSEMEQGIFQHFALHGEEGSGKMSFIELLSQQFHAESASPEVANENRLIVVTLEETFDSKNLVGTYVCNESGEFVFKKGPLTVAAEEGLWLVLRHIEKAPSDLLSFLLPLVQENVLQVTAAFSIVPKLGFRIFALCHQTNRPTEDIKPFLNHLSHISLDKLMDLNSVYSQREDFESEILPNLYPLTFSVSWIPTMLLSSVRDFLQPRLNQLRAQMLDNKPLSVRQVFKTFSRVEAFLALHYKPEQLSSPGFYLASNARMCLLEDIIDNYLGYLYDRDLKQKVIIELVQEIWNKTDQAAAMLDPQTVADYVTQQTRNYGISDSQCYFGRSSNMMRVKSDQDDEMLSESQENTRSFVYTGNTLRLMEQIAQAIGQSEAALLVGETGTGKTTSVQELAKLLGRKMHVFNMNQNTDSSDLLGGFKPVDLKFLLRPIYERFLSVFKAEFKNLEKNKKFLDLTQKCYEENRVKEFLQCLNHGVSAVRGKKNYQVTDEMAKLEGQIAEVHKRANKLESGGGFIFQFIEGTLIKSIKDGEWILLDEINLASESVLNRIATLIDGDYILLNERADIIETKRHKDFRLFLCMNPPYTSAGKKQLPWSLRSKLTEIYVPELDNQNDLWMIIDKNCSTQVTEQSKRKILEFYTTVRDQVQKQTKKGNIGLRNLSRSLSFMKSAIALKYPVLKAIYDSLFTCFASHLDQNLQNYISALIYQLFDIKHMPQLNNLSEHQLSEKFIFVEQFIIARGKFKNEHFNEKDFVTTNSFKKLLKQLAGVVAVSDYAVILQGPTSAGKTSTVQYLANITHNKVIRINNHMHTDIQEYLGSYVPDKEGGGKLIFQEGVLVEAVRNGYWVILDELNLAPSEVLEALNRLLDDNRELLIVETQKVIKAHPNFRIFATQNPTEGYGGRKELSEAFKNRFILINVHDVPLDELTEILIHKCEIPKSRAEVMVKVMEQLQIYRSQGSNLFSGKDSTITVRDLLKWAARMTHQALSSSVVELAMEGFLVLGERARNIMDKQFIKETIERVTKVKIDERNYYEEYFQKNLALQFSQVPQQLSLPRLIQSQQLKRLAVLVHKCLLNQEPVLLVGETGCGKTTLCQVFAVLGSQPLFSINCHQNTETSDFIGCMRTRKNIKHTQDQFVSEYQALTSDLQLIDIELSIDASMSIKQLRTKFSLLQKEAKAIALSQEQKVKLELLKALRDDLACIFEWHDGILVEAMQQGGLLLIDEISLANDSVLERLNSVFEADRTLVISEKSSKEAVKIVGHQKFKMVATMNPSGDFGKKELSPALRNRMTEIWVESYFQQDELIKLYKDSKNNQVFTEVSSSVDLFIIVEETAYDKLGSKIQDKKQIKKLALGIFNMIGFVNFILAQRFFALQRKALSIRDILSMIDFIQETIDKVFNFNLVLALRHAVNLVIIDGLCLGIDVSGDKQKNDILTMCNDFLANLERCLFNYGDDKIENMDYIETNDVIGVSPFVLGKNSLQASSSNYAFDAHTTKINLLKLLRAYQLNKPILIEGPPGVGKTSLVENLAKVTGRKLIRVNLSEQTDMMDLLGSEYPVSTSHSETKKADDDEDDIRFHWCDGVLLQAIKEGHWFLIDEMNLAQQSVLEGLNAILDHRRTVYIPELNIEFKCHPNFFVFACQNPSQSASSVGGRKTLPKSFLNRFNKIFLEELTQQDYSCIIQRQVKSREIEGFNVSKLLSLSRQIEQLIKDDMHTYQDEGVINMRDLSRFLTLYRCFNSQDQASQSQSLLHAFRICYLQRLSEQKQGQAIDLLFASGLITDANLELSKAQVVRIDQTVGTLHFLNKVKHTSLHQDLHSISYTISDFTDLKGSHSTQLQLIVDCINCNIPILLVTNQPQRLIENLQTIAKITGKKLNRILLNDRSDTAQLLGCFEQTASDISNLVKQIECIKNEVGESQLMISIMELEHYLKKHMSDHGKQIHAVRKFIAANSATIDLKAIEQCLHEFEHITKRGGSSRFEWVDSVLVKSIVDGEWAVFENANLCNPSILDRLNPLLEEGNTSLCINEQGLTEGDKMRDIKAHDSFRSIFVISQQSLVDQGKDVSRALRNRCLQININYQQNNTDSGDQAVIDSRLMQFQSDFEVVHTHQMKKGVSETYQSISNEVSGIGKRSKREAIDGAIIEQVLNYEVAQLETFFSKDSTYLKRFAKAYLHFLTDLVGTDNAHSIIQYGGPRFKQLSLQLEFIGSQLSQKQDPWSSHTQYRISSKKSKIEQSLRERAHTFNKQSQLFLQNLLFQQSSSAEYFFILREVLECLKCKDYNGIQSYRNLYLLLHTGNHIVSMTGADSDPIMKVLQSRRSQVEGDYEMEGLNEVKRYGPNRIRGEHIKAIKRVQLQLEDIKQQPLMICVKSLLSPKQGELKVGLQALLENFIVLMLDDDKSIKRYTSTTLQKIDPYLLQEKLQTAYAIIVPQSHQAEKTTILISLSDLYQPLCLLKDLLKLRKASTDIDYFKRLTNIPTNLGAFQSDSILAMQAALLRAVTLDNLESLYTEQSENFQIDLIQNVLESASRTRLRDMPAQYLCASALQTVIGKLLQLEPTIEHHQPLAPLPINLLQSDLVKEYLAVNINEGKANTVLLDNLGWSLSEVHSLGSTLQQTIETLFVIPLEIHRLEQRQELSKDHLAVKHAFIINQYRSEEEADRQTGYIKVELDKLGAAHEKLSKIRPQGEAEQQLRGLILYLSELHNMAMELYDNILSKVIKQRSIADLVRLMSAMMLRGTNQYFLNFNNILTPYLQAAQTLVQSVKKLLYRQNELVLAVNRALFQVRPQRGVLTVAPHKIDTLCLIKKQANQLLYERYLTYLLRFSRLQKCKKQHQLLLSVTLDHFVHREVALRIKQEELEASLDELVYRLPFKLKVQSLMEMNKAYGDRTQEDKDKMEKEARAEIETNFPSYFDEFQKLIFSGIMAGEVKKKDKEDRISVSKLLTEMLSVESALDQRPAEQRRSLVKLRLKMLYELHNEAQDDSIGLNDKDNGWLREISNFLREELSHSALPSVMNVSEVRLSPTYNFYHDALPHEARLVHDPLSKLIIRIDFIMQDFESPILQDAIFLANYMLTSFSAKTAPLMKLLTGLELLLNKLDEWEVYASKSINSCTNEMTLIKQLIIRYRKIQILSWRNLLQWRKTQMVQEDFRENFVRIAHTLERQVFDRLYYSSANKKLGWREKSVELQVMEVCDLFMRDSSLGQFQSRLAFLQLLLAHFKAKAKQNASRIKPTLINLLEHVKLNKMMTDRLTRVINVLDFVCGYYSQFREKLSSTLARLDAAAREKVKTLIDVSKWTVQKFAQVKNNIDKRHRQLNKACKQEEEALMQNVSQLVLTSSRKRYVKTQEGLAGLEQEKTTLSLGHQQQPKVISSIKKKSIQKKGKVVKFVEIAAPSEQKEEPSTLLDIESQIQFTQQPLLLVPVIQQMQILEKKRFETRWPDCMAVEQMIAVLFQRLKIVRDIDRKHIQRRAFIDLQKYMKDQGLQHNFQSNLQPMLLETKIVSLKMDNVPGDEYRKYYLKSHELLMMLENSGEVVDTGSEHLRNVEIIRVRGFSQSLIQKMLLMNTSLAGVKAQFKKLNKLNKESKSFMDQAPENQQVSCQYSEKTSKLYESVAIQFYTLCDNITDQLTLLEIADAGGVSQVITLPTEKLNMRILTEIQASLLSEKLTQVKTSLITYASKCGERQRILINEDFIVQIDNLEAQLKSIAVQSMEEIPQEESMQLIAKRVRILQKRSQLFVQETLQAMEHLYEIQRRDSIVTDGAMSTIDLASIKGTPHVLEEEDRVELTIKEYQEFSEKLLTECFEKQLPAILSLSEKIFTFKGIREPLSSQDKTVTDALCLAAHLFARVTGLVQFVLENQYLYMRSLAKFSFISQRIFIYLIFEGFCGQDDKEEEDNKDQQEDDKYFENDGMGMGDGKGGKENVSNQIENEEQVEGLKNYESEEEKPEEEKEEDKKDEEEDDQNDFEMKDGDFDGELEDKPEKEEDGEEEEDKKDEESDEDDELDEVDDLLDNKLWNENMQDLEDQQEEDSHPEDKPEKEDVDLGERDIDEENQLPQKPEEKELTAGDNDKQDDKTQKEDQEMQEEQVPDGAEDEEMEENDEQKDEEDEKDGDEIPLDRDPNVVEEIKEEDEISDDKSEGSKGDKEDNEPEKAEENEDGEEEKSEVDSQYSENDHEQLNSEADASHDDDDQDDYASKQQQQQEPTPLEDDNKQDETKRQQNVQKRPTNTSQQNQQKSKRDEDQAMNNDDNQQTQFDVEGSDILYQLSNKIKQQKQNQDKPKQNDQDSKAKKDDSKKEMENPQMNNDKQQESAGKQEPMADDEAQDAMEYEFDRDAEQMQGRLATDQVEEADRLQVPDEEEDQIMQQEDEESQGADGKTQAEAQQLQSNQATEAKQAVDEQTKHPKKDADDIMQDGQEGGDQPRELIDDYQDYIDSRKQLMELTLEEDKQTGTIGELSTFLYDLDQFDIAKSRQRIRDLFQGWQIDPENVSQSLQLLQRFKQETSTSAASLCEQLRIVLEPQLSQQLQGDYKTGKRLNMKKVISFIASHYRNDKIWLRRTLPSKRDYRILVAIDDTLSMREGGLGFFSLEALTAITEALHRLEVGKVAVAAIRERMELLQTFEEGAQQSNERTAFVLSQFGFNFSAPKSADYAMANFVRDANQMLDMSTVSADVMNLPFVIVLSDGRFNKNNVRPYLNEAREKRYLYIFVILDSVKEPTEPLHANKKIKQSDGSILSMKSVEKGQEGGIKLVPYLKDFPFEYYCIVRDIHQLPAALGSILVQWFSLINNGA